MPLLKKRFIVKNFLNLASQRGASLIEYSLVCSLLILLAIPSVRKIAGKDESLDRTLLANGDAKVLGNDKGSGIKGRLGDVVRGFQNCTGINGENLCSEDDDVF